MGLWFCRICYVPATEHIFLTEFVLQRYAAGLVYILIRIPLVRCFLTCSAICAFVCRFLFVFVHTGFWFVMKPWFGVSSCVAASVCNSKIIILCFCVTPFISCGTCLCRFSVACISCYNVIRCYSNWPYVTEFLRCLFYLSRDFHELTLFTIYSRKKY